MEDLETELLRHFAVREERFDHGDFAVDLLLPRSADELIDVSAFNTDERLPYWADLWPSARALTRWLLDGPPPPGPVLELGCGVALPSLALGWRGVRAVASDYYPEALDFARANAMRNSIRAPDPLLLDWRHPPREPGRFPLVVAADVLYEKRNGEALAELLPRAVAAGGRAVLADPGRVYASGFLERMRGAGWGVGEVAAFDEPSGAPGSGASSRIRIWELAPR